MKRTLVVQVLPLIIVLAAGWFFLGNPAIQKKIFGTPEQTKTSGLQLYIHALNGDSMLEQQLFRSGADHENIFLFGSSELTGDVPAHARRFISEQFSTDVVAVGEAGNQCFSIYSMMLANRMRLKNAPVVIILSPGWFAGDAAKGTNSTKFTDFNSERFVNRIYALPEDSFRSYFISRLADYYSDWGSPSVSYRRMYLEQISKQSFLHQAYCRPLTAGSSAIISARNNIFGLTENTSSLSFAHKDIIAENKKINWDSLFAESKASTLSKATNNELAVNNEYYTQYIHGQRGSIQAVSRAQMKEMDDFHQLVRLLKAEGVNASFVIIPLNPLYYENLSELDPIVNELSSTAKQNGIPTYNMFNSDPAKFEKGILSDVMHPSNYGWYKIDQFIVNQYHLSR